MSLKSEVRLNSDYSYSLSLSVTITITIWQITAASFKLGSWHSDARRALCFFPQSDHAAQARSELEKETEIKQS